MNVAHFCYVGRSLGFGTQSVSTSTSEMILSDINFQPFDQLTSVYTPLLKRLEMKIIEIWTASSTEALRALAAKRLFAVKRHVMVLQVMIHNCSLNSSES